MRDTFTFGRSTLQMRHSITLKIKQQHNNDSKHFSNVPYGQSLLYPAVCSPRCCMRFLTSSVSSSLSERRDTPLRCCMKLREESLLFTLRLLRRLVQCMLFFLMSGCSDWSLLDELRVRTFGSSPFSLVSIKPSVLTEPWKWR